MIQFDIADEADQQFGAILDDRRVTIRLRYNPSNDRWSFDLSIDDVPVLNGRRIVTGFDLLKAFNFGIGALIAWVVVPGAVPDRASLPNASVRLYHVPQAEIDATIS